MIHRTSRGFTLTEVAVAVAIIALLAVLLIPAMKQGLASAKAAKCQGNLRNISQAFNQYAGDNGNRLPPSWIGGNNDFNNSWWYYLAIYLGKSQPTSWGDITRLCDPNNGPLGCPETNPNAPGYVLPWMSYKMSRNFRTTSAPGVSVLSITHPAKTLLVSEGRGHPDFSSSLAVSGASSSQNQTQGLVYPHGGRVNALFVDGHVERLDPKAMADIWNNAYLNIFQ